MIADGVQKMVDGVLMKEKKNLIKTLNAETGVEESQLSIIRVIGKKIYTAKQAITDGGAGYGEEKEEMIQTDITMDCVSDCECELQNFKNEWEEKWNPSIQEDEPGIITSGDAVTIIVEKALSYETDNPKFIIISRGGRKVESIHSRRSSPF